MRQMLAAYQGNVALYLIALVSKARGNRFDFMRVWDSQLVSQVSDGCQERQRYDNDHAAGSSGELAARAE